MAILEAKASNAKHMTFPRLRAEDPKTYDTPFQRRVDAAHMLTKPWNEIASMVERALAGGNAVHVVNKTGGPLTAPVFINLADDKLTDLLSFTATNNPLAGASASFTVAATSTLSVGDLVKIQSGGFTEYAVVDTITPTTSFTVDFLNYDHTLPTVDTIRAYELTEASASGNKPADWVIPVDLADNLYTFAFQNVIIEGIDTSAFTAEKKAFLSDLTAGAMKTTAPTGVDTFVQVVGVIHKSDASTGVMHAFPGNKTIEKISESMLQAGINAFNPYEARIKV